MRNASSSLSSRSSSASRWRAREALPRFDFAMSSSITSFLVFRRSGASASWSPRFNEKPPPSSSPSSSSPPPKCIAAVASRSRPPPRRSSSESDSSPRRRDAPRASACADRRSSRFSSMGAPPWVSCIASSSSSSCPPSPSSSSPRAKDCFPGLSCRSRARASRPMDRSSGVMPASPSPNRRSTNALALPEASCSFSNVFLRFAVPAARALSASPLTPRVLRPRISNFNRPERASKTLGFSAGASRCACENRCLDFLPVAGLFFFFFAMFGSPRRRAVRSADRRKRGNSSVGGERTAAAGDASNDSRIDRRVFPEEKDSADKIKRARSHTSSRCLVRRLATASGHYA